jgi:hypothetical protein
MNSQGDVRLAVHRIVYLAMEDVAVYDVPVHSIHSYADGGLSNVLGDVVYDAVYDVLRKELQ